MITTKPKGCISAVQLQANAQPIFADNFPQTCLLSKYVYYDGLIVYTM